jgi:CBS domain-containing protein
MSDKVLYVTPDQTVDECMAIMTESTSATCRYSTTTGWSSASFRSATWSRKRSRAQQFIIQQMEKYITGTTIHPLPEPPVEP